MEKSELPQSKIGSEEPIFASPLLKEGAKIAPHRGARAIGPPFHIARVNNKLLSKTKNKRHPNGWRFHHSLGHTTRKNFTMNSALIT